MVRSDSVMVDTNIIIYALVEEEPDKSEKALKLLEELSKSKIQIFLTVQSLKEVGNVAHRKYGLRSDELEEVMDTLKALTPNLIPETFTTVPLAVRLKEDYGIEYWDALIVASCLEHGIPLLITEDERLYKVGQINLDGKVVEFLNPFEV